MFYLKKRCSCGGRIMVGNYRDLLTDEIKVGSGVCELPFEQRPLNCRMLEPRPRELGCTAHGFMKEAAAREWLPYQKIIAKAIDIYYNED